MKTFSKSFFLCILFLSILAVIYGNDTCKNEKHLNIPQRESENKDNMKALTISKNIGIAAYLFQGEVTKYYEKEYSITMQQDSNLFLEQFVQEPLKNDLTLPIKVKVYEKFLDANKSDSSLSENLFYQDTLMSETNLLTNINLNSDILNDKIRSDILDFGKQLAKDTTKQKKERIVFIGVIVFVLILAMVLIFVFRLQSTKNKQKKIIAENKQIIAEKQQKIVELELEKEKNEKLLLKQQLKEQETSALLEQERLNNENKELSSKIVLESNKNNLIEEIVNKLSSLPNQSQGDELKLIIKQLKAQLKESPQWENFYTYFEKINPIFLASLKKKYPDLTRNDIQYLSYVYLNLNAKEIASLLHISEASCMKKKQRIAEKMNLKTTELYTYLLTLE